MNGAGGPASAIEHYRVEWRPDLTTRWSLGSSHDKRVDADAAAVHHVGRFGGQTRVVAQTVVAVIGAHTDWESDEEKLIHVGELRAAVRRLQLFVVIDGGDEGRSVAYRNIFERPRVVDALRLDDVWAVIDEAVASSGAADS